jgi:hypothetical protein
VALLRYACDIGVTAMLSPQPADLTLMLHVSVSCASVQFLLFDLVEDPYERINLYDSTESHIISAKVSVLVTCLWEVVHSIMYLTHVSVCFRIDFTTTLEDLRILSVMLPSVLISTPLPCTLYGMIMRGT